MIIQLIFPTLCIWLVIFYKYDKHRKVILLWTLFFIVEMYFIHTKHMILWLCTVILSMVGTFPYYKYINGKKK